MDEKYIGEHKTIRAIWYSMKPYMQSVGITDKVATRYIGEWLWKQFVVGDREVYGEIGNSSRVQKNKLPIVLFCEKNTLNPFADLPEYIYANVYMASGQANSYELANIVNAIDSPDIFLYLVTDFDKAGEDIGKSLTSKLGLFFNVYVEKFNVDFISAYETYIQPNGDEGLELDAVYDLEEKVLEDLEEFLPYGLFKDVAIEDRTWLEYQDLMCKDAVLIELDKQAEDRKRDLWEIADEYDYAYTERSNLYNLTDRVVVTKPTASK